MPSKDKNKVRIADTAIDGGYITLGEAAEYTAQSRQAVRQRALRRKVDAKQRRAARIVKTLAEIGKLLKESKD